MIINDLSALTTFINQLAPLLKPGSALLLQGELGAGKTTFTKQLASALKITDVVSSPSFNIKNRYYWPGGKCYLLHFDLYRLKSPVNLLDYDEHFGDNLIVIEWAEKLGHFDQWFKNYLWLTITINQDQSRTIKVKGQGPIYQAYQQRFSQPRKENVK